VNGAYRSFVVDGHDDAVGCVRLHYSAEGMLKGRFQICSWNWWSAGNLMGWVVRLFGVGQELAVLHAS
jgi:hypothetical protein